MFDTPVRFLAHQQRTYVKNRGATVEDRLKIGDRVIEESLRDENRLLRWIRAIGRTLNADGTTSNTSTAEISFFFGIFDWMVTEGTQKVVSVIMDTKNRADLRFIGRERARSYMLQSIPLESPLAALIVTYHYGECADSLTALQLTEARLTKGPIRSAPRRRHCQSRAAHQRRKMR
jgi:hypothetical protein